MIPESTISCPTLPIPRTRYAEGMLSLSLAIEARGETMTLQVLQDYEAIRCTSSTVVIVFFPPLLPTVLHHHDVFRENPGRCLSARAQLVGDDSVPQDTSRGPIQDKGSELLLSRSRNILGSCGRSKASVRG